MHTGPRERSYGPACLSSSFSFSRCFVFTYLRISLAFRIMSSVRRSCCFIYLLILLYYYFRVLSGRSFAFLLASFWATSLVFFFFFKLLSYFVDSQLKRCVCVSLFFSAKKSLRPALKLEQKLFWASLDYWLFGRRVLHWQNQFLLLFKIYWNLEATQLSLPLPTTTSTAQHCCCFLLCRLFRSLSTASDFSRSVKQSALSLQLGLGSGFFLCCNGSAVHELGLRFFFLCAPITQALAQLER